MAEIQRNSASVKIQEAKLGNRVFDEKAFPISTGSPEVSRIHSEDFAE